MAAITALTAQNTRGVSAIHVPPVQFLTAQIEAIFADIDVAAVKIGMLGSAEVVETVAACLSTRRSVPIVVDPVLVATSGAALGDDTVVAAMRAHLLPLASLVTPNLPEAARLADRPLPASEREVEALAHVLRTICPTAWLVKGGHATSAEAADLLVDASGSRWFRSPRIATRNTHGTGCTLSSAIAAGLARGAALRAAIEHAKAYLDEALSGADRLHVGTGPGPVDHFARWRD